MMRTLFTLALVGALTACGAGSSRRDVFGPPLPPLTLRASVNGAAAANVSSPYALNLPQIGDVGVVTAYVLNQQVAFSVVSASGCSGIVTISPATSSMQQAVTSVATGTCTVNAVTAGGDVTTLAIFSLPPP